MGLKKEKERFLCVVGDWVMANPAENAVKEALQRGGRGKGKNGKTFPTYSPKIRKTDPRRVAFRESWQDDILAVEGEYNKPISTLSEAEKEHTARIESIRQGLAKKHGDILHQGKIRFGVAQKALNLHIKVRWCKSKGKGKILYPLHCTLDDNVLTKAGWSGTPWSRMDSPAEYDACIEKCREAANNCSRIQKMIKDGCIREEEILAAWELLVWNSENAK